MVNIRQRTANVWPVREFSANGSGTSDSPFVPVSTSYEHQRIHSGNHFYVADYLANQAISAEVELVITRPDVDTEAHMVINIYSSTGATVDVYEGSSNIVDGTEITPINNNRDSSTDSAISLLLNPSSITDGTKIAGYLAGGARTAGFSKRDDEDILKRNTSYLIRITSLAAANNISWSLSWYEEE